MKLVAYCRVSSVGQEDNTSLQYQEDKLRAYCALHDHELVKVFIEAKSGKDTNRKQYQAMLDMLPLVDGILVFKLDRLTRNVKDLLVLLDDVLKPQGKELLSFSEKLDTSDPRGRFFLQMIGSMAEMERSLIAERCAAGRAAAKAQGKHIGGGELRYGYYYDKKSGKVVEHKEEQKVIAQMRHWYEVEGWYCREIAEELNRLRVPTKLNRGSLWTASKVSRIFNKLGDKKPVRMGAMVAVKKERQGLDKVSPEVKTTISELSQQGMTQRQIADELNRLGLVSVKGGKFDQGLVSRVRFICGV